MTTRLQRLSIRAIAGALLAGILLSSVALLTVTLIGRQQRDNTNEQVARKATEIGLFEEARSGSITEGATAATYYALRQPQYIADFYEARVETDAALADLVELSGDGGLDDAAFVAALAQRHAELADSMERFLNALADGDDLGAIAIVIQENVEERARDVGVDLRDAAANAEAALVAAQRRDEAALNLWNWIYVAAVASSATLGTLGALAVFLWIVQPINRVSAATQRIAAGEISLRIPQRGPAEMVQMGRGINTMADALIERSEQLNRYLSKDLERRTAELEQEVLDRKRAEEQIRYQANHDFLTGLPNRTLLMDRMDQALAQARRDGHTPAVMFLDLDHFKLVNDTLGHSAGDELLQHVADRLLAIVREGDSLARVGGDEFVVLLHRVEHADDIPTAAGRILQQLRSPWHFRGREFNISASIGIARFPDHGADAETLLRNADAAMYHAKDSGRDNFQTYAPALHSYLDERVTLEAELRRGIERGEFVLHYQPEVQTHDGQILGVEALIRWQHPERGELRPAEFIPVAEETGLITTIGQWVLETACAQAKAWCDRGLLLPNGRMAVNVSPRQFQDHGLVELVRRALDDAGLPPQCLELEITEGTAMRDIDHSIATLGELKRMGVRLAIDDFGTGYSSLSYLRRFPIDTVKIDQSFVQDALAGHEAGAIVAAIVGLAESLSMHAVAEGVETIQQVDFLKEERCPAYQGFRFSKALPASQLEELLATSAASAPPADQAAAA